MALVTSSAPIAASRPVPRISAAYRVGYLLMQARWLWRIPASRSHGRGCSAAPADRTRRQGRPRTLQNRAGEEELSWDYSDSIFDPGPHDHLPLLLESCRNASVCVIPIAAKTKSHCDDGHRDDAGGDQAVFNRRGSRLVIHKTQNKSAHRITSSQDHLARYFYNHRNFMARKGNQ